jgi:hypothetical protein
MDLPWLKRVVLRKFLVFLSIVIGAVTLAGVFHVSVAQPSQLTTFKSPTGPQSTPTLPPRSWLPVVMKNYPFVYSTSYYVKIADYNTLYDLGCSQGHVTADGQDIVVVLDFGQPAYNGSAYGSYIFDAPYYTFKSISQLTDGAKGFLSGFYHCSPLYAYLKLAVGLNNEGPYVNNAHGRAWAQMVNDLNAWISANFYGSQESARGGMDIELEYPFGTAVATRDWASGYNAVFIAPSYYLT